MLNRLSRNADRKTPTTTTDGDEMRASHKEGQSIQSL